MPRLSMWKEGQHTADYRFFDRLILEQFQIGATGILVHLFLGVNNQSPTIATNQTQTTVNDPIGMSSTATILPGMYVAGPGITQGTTVLSKDATTITLSAPTTGPIASGTSLAFYTDPSQPPALNQSAQNIQDLLFLENRDRKYDPNVYTMRGHYRLSDVDFDLSQFGLLLTGDTIFMTVHLNDMVEKIGRKLMIGDVIELPHLKDYYPLDDGLTAALKRYYVVQDATKSAEGFSPTWWPHLWRIKLQPMVDAQEFKDILNNLPGGDNTTTPVGDILSTLQKYLNVNDAIVEAAEANVPYSGYDTSSIYHEAETPPPKEPGALQTTDTSATAITADDELRNTDNGTLSSSAKVQGYLTGDGLGPNGMPVGAGIAFPLMPQVGDYFLRVDYVPNRLFRYNGGKWMKVEDKVRTNLTPGASDNGTQLNSFINNDNFRYSGKLGWDIIEVADPYTPESGSITQSFAYSTRTIITTFPYTVNGGIKCTLNGGKVNVTWQDFGGYIGFVVPINISIGDRIEYGVFKNAIKEKQNLNTALRPGSDN